MARPMTPEEIELLLAQHFVVRLGCSAGGETYVVPVAYVWDGSTGLYAFSYEGRKLSTMRSNPVVCVEIDEVEHLGRWRSVIGWGRFEELAGDERYEAMELLALGLAPHIDDDESRRRLDRALADDPPPAVFRVVIETMSGRVEGE